MHTTTAQPANHARYRLEEPLGSGAMGSVHRAYDRLTGQRVALKQVHIQTPTADPLSTQHHQALLLALINEFRTLAGLRHPNIISVLDYGVLLQATPTGKYQRIPFFTMELLPDAINLLTAARPRPSIAQIDLLSQLLQALSYLHRRGIVHRDLKPDNVLVSGDSLRALDFGLAASLTNATGRTGTIAYMSPETVQHAIATPQSDLYAVGVMLYELLTGSFPHRPGDVIALLRKTPDYTPLQDNPLLPVIQRLLEKQPDQRYPSADATRHALYEAIDHPLPPEHEAIRESYLQFAPFIGRDTELQQLETAMRSIEQRYLADVLPEDRPDQPTPPATWLIGGESGVGKTRLIEELRIRALLGGWLTLRGQATEGSSLPMNLWRQPLYRLALETNPTDQQASILLPHLPDLERLLERPIAPIATLGGQAERQRLAHTIADLLRAYGRQTIWLLEDLHWANDSLLLLTELLPLIGGLPVMIVGSYRDDEARDLPTRFPTMQPLHLPRLRRDQLDTLSRAILGDTSYSADLLDLLEAETEGNIFFVVETIRALAEEAGHLSAVGQDTLPDHVFSEGMAALLRRRLQRVPDWGQTALRVAAVNGRYLNLDLLAELLPADFPLQTWLMTCNEVAVLEIDDQRWRFAHDKLREATLADLAPTERINLHQQIAETLERQHASDAAYAPILLEHWTHAQQPAHARPYILPTVTGLLRQGDNTTARRWIDFGLDFTPPGDPHRLRLRNANTALLLLERRLDEADSYTQQTVALAEAAGDHRAMAIAYNYLSNIAFYRGDFTQVIELAQRGQTLARQADDPRTIASANINLGAAAWQFARYDLAITYYEQALEMLDGDDHFTNRIIARSNLGTAYRERGLYRRARQVFAQNLADCQAANYQVGVGQAMYQLAIIHFNEGRHTEAHDLIESCRQLRRRINTDYGEAELLCIESMVYLSQLDFTAAETAARRSIELFESNPISEYSRGLAEGFLGDALLEQRRIDEAEAIYRISQERRQRTSDNIGIVTTHCGLARVALRRDDWNTGRAHLRDALTTATQIKTHPIIGILAIAMAEWAGWHDQFLTGVYWLGWVGDQPQIPRSIQQQAERLMLELRAYLPPLKAEQALNAALSLSMEKLLTEMDTLLRDPSAL